ncbi:MAG: HAD family hydrolase [Anaerolineales bacterium]|nr:HAD family hydrolase [Anaerolineales bacterium]
MTTLPPCLLLDLDDTILDYTASGRCCWRELCQDYAPRIGVEAALLRAAIRRSSDDYWSDPERHRLGRLDLPTARRDVLRQALAELQVQQTALGDEIADAFTLRREEWVTPFPGAIEALQAFQQRGIRMGLVTNGSSEFQRSKIRRFDLARYFETTLIEGEFGTGKPDRRVFQAALQALDASPAETWMVGDDLERDILPAGELGLDTVWVDFEGNSLSAESPAVPGRIVRALAELRALL